MKNKITLILLALSLLMPAVASAAGYRFDYDLSGNRIKRVYLPAQAGLFYAYSAALQPCVQKYTFFYK